MICGQIRDDFQELYKTAFMCLKCHKIQVSVKLNKIGPSVFALGVGQHNNNIHTLYIQTFLNHFFGLITDISVENSQSICLQLLPGLHTFIAQSDYCLYNNYQVVQYIYNF